MRTKKIMVIGVFILLGLVIVLYLPSIRTYNVPQVERGFIMGARTESSFIFPFYDHPTEENAPLKQFDTLYSNKLYLYTLGYRDVTQEDLRVKMYRVEVVKTENGTQENVIDETEFNATLTVTQYKIVKNELEFPRHDEIYHVELYSMDGRRIFAFMHETHPVFIPARHFTLGSLFMDRLVYILSALLISIFALGLARMTVDRRQVVPQVGTGTALWLMSMSGVVLYIGARLLIYTFGVINLWWTYFPLLFSSYLFGFSILKPNTSLVYLMKTVKAHRPTKEVYPYEVVSVENVLYLAKISWGDFLMGKRTKLSFEEGEFWSWNIKDSEDAIYIFKSIEKKGYEIKITLEGIHEKDVDEALSDITTLEVIAKEKNEWRTSYLRERATKEVEIRRRLIDYVGNIEEALEKEEIPHE